jgi:hypothetical protein
MFQGRVTNNRIKNRGNVVTEAIQISPEEVYPKVKSGEAILVCAYNDDEEYKRINLEGSISLSEFYSRLPQYSKDQEIIFY